MSSCSFDATAPQQAEATNLREPTCPPCTIDPDPSQTYFCPKNGKGCDRISIHTCQSGKCEARIWKTTYMIIIFLFSVSFHFAILQDLHFADPSEISCRVHALNILSESFGNEQSIRHQLAPKERDMEFERRRTWGNRPMIFPQTAKLQGFHYQSLNKWLKDWGEYHSLAFVFLLNSCSEWTTLNGSTAENWFLCALTSSEKLSTRTKYRSGVSWLKNL